VIYYAYTKINVLVIKAALMFVFVTSFDVSNF